MNRSLRASSARNRTFAAKHTAKLHDLLCVLGSLEHPPGEAVTLTLCKAWRSVSSPSTKGLTKPRFFRPASILALEVHESFVLRQLALLLVARCGMLLCAVWQPRTLSGLLQTQQQAPIAFLGTTSATLLYAGRAQADQSRGLHQQARSGEARDSRTSTAHSPCHPAQHEARWRVNRFRPVVNSFSGKVPDGHILKNICWLLLGEQFKTMCPPCC